MADDPRTDPVGTVRQNPDGRIAVKTTMGNDNTGSGHHVWCITDDCIEHRWLHHVEVARWPVFSTPLPDSEWTSVSEIAGFLSTIMNTEKARGAAEFIDRGYRLVRREEASRG